MSRSPEKPALIFLVIIISSMLIVFLVNKFESSERPTERIYKSLVFENDTVQIFHFQKYRLIEIGADTVYRKKRVRSSLEYQAR